MIRAVSLWHFSGEYAILFGIVTKREESPMVSLLLALIYLSFISLGLPDSLLGTAWPVMYPQLGVEVSSMGIVSFIISCGTIVSSLNSDRLTRRFGAGKVTAVSVAMTALALLGFSFSGSFWMLCVLAIPYGLGAGSVDAALNNYVAVHYASRHMSWLHCMWGVGASIGPYIMSFALSRGQWNAGYRCVGLVQIVISAILFLSLPLWNRQKKAAVTEGSGTARSAPLSLKQVLAIPGVKGIIITFFCYCALEWTALQWAASYLVLHLGIEESTAAGYGGLFLLGMTIGRALSGFLTFKFNDTQMIRIGSCVVFVGLLAMLLPLGITGTLIGLFVIGFGCAPIYPSIIHCTPTLFGAEKSQTIIGVQMAAAYTGSLIAPPILGLIIQYITPGFYPWFVLIGLAAMTVGHEALVKKTAT